MNRLSAKIAACSIYRIVQSIFLELLSDVLTNLQGIPHVRKPENLLKTTFLRKSFSRKLFLTSKNKNIVINLSDLQKQKR